MNASSRMLIKRKCGLDRKITTCFIASLRQTHLLSKVELSDSYMRIWVCLLDIYSVAFLVPQDMEDECY